MASDLTPDDRVAVENIVGRLEAAWNAMDGAAFGAPFAEDADFVTIRAEHFRGRPAIAAGHTAIFQTIYAGSTNRYTVETVRQVRPGVALAHVHAELNAPTGPLAGRHNARFSALLTKEASGWEIASFHNTLEPPPGRN
jgi:uncharacterized protein (TIGR02246 family)